MDYIQINTWAFPYWHGYLSETPILARDGVESQYGSRDDNIYYKIISISRSILLGPIWALTSSQANMGVSFLDVGSM
jgi:hypothetical protein